MPHVSAHSLAAVNVHDTIVPASFERHLPFCQCRHITVCNNRSKRVRSTRSSTWVKRQLQCFYVAYRRCSYKRGGSAVNAGHGGIPTPPNSCLALDSTNPRLALSIRVGSTCVCTFQKYSSLAFAMPLLRGLALALEVGPVCLVLAPVADAISEVCIKLSATHDPVIRRAAPGA